MGSALPDRSDLLPETTNDALRSHQANERTLLAWVRTGIAMMGLGFVVARFGIFLHQFRDGGVAGGAAAAPSGNPNWSLWTGVALVALGALSIGAATVRYAAVRTAIVRGAIEPPGSPFVYAIAAMIAVGGLAMIAVLVATR